MPLVLWRKMVEEHHGWSGEVAASFWAEARSMRTHFHMVFLLIVGYPFSASKIVIAARNFCGVNDMFYNVASVVAACGYGAAVALVREIGTARWTYNMPHSTLRKRMN
jgi:hypothetical protein